MAEQMIEEDASMDDPRLGLQPDGSVVTHPKDCVHAWFDSLDWDRPLKKTTNSRPWMEPSDFRESLATKNINYLTESNIIDLSNPLTKGCQIKKFREKETRVKRKSKVSQMNLISEGVEGRNPKSQSASSDASDDFLDEFGNVKSSGSSDEESEEDNKGKGKKQKGRAHRDEPPKPQEVEKEKPKGSASKIPPPSTNKIPVPTFKKPGKEPQSESESTTTTTDQDSPMKRRDQALELDIEPCSSTLSRKEQMVFLELMKKFRFINADTMRHNEDDYRTYQLYLDMVKQEQKKYQEWAKESYYFNARLHLNKIYPQVKRFADEYYTWKLNRIKRFPRLYHPCNKVNSSMVRLIPFFNEQMSIPQFEMRIVKPLVEIGIIPKVQIPNPNKNFQNKRGGGNRRLPFYEKLKPKTMLEDSPTDTLANFAKVGVSYDQNAEKLSDVYKPDVVICASALKTIIDNHMPKLDEEWIIPFTVKHHGSKKVLYLDKPLPPISMTADQKQSVYVKKATKVTFIYPWTRSFQAKPKSHNLDDVGQDNSPKPTTPPPSPKKQTGADLSSSSEKRIICPVDDNLFEDDSDLETFGTGASQVDGTNDLSDEDDEERIDLHRVVQVDGGQDSSSDEDRMVIDLEPEEQPIVYPQRLTRSRTRKDTCLKRPTILPPKQRIKNKKEASRAKTKPGGAAASSSTDPNPSQGEEQQSDSSEISLAKTDVQKSVTEKEIPTEEVEKKSDLCKYERLLATAGTSGIRALDQSSKSPIESPQKESASEIRFEASQDVAGDKSNENSDESQDESFSGHLDNILQRCWKDKRERYEMRMKERLERQMEHERQQHQQQQSQQQKQQQQKSESFLGNIISAQSSMFISKQEAPKIQNFQNVDRDMPIFEQYDGEELQTFDDEAKDLTFVKPRHGSNVSYRLWDLRQKGNVSNNLRVIIRSSTHGMQRISSEGVQRVTLSTKIERQPKMGAEVMTQKEISREWIATLIRPNGILARSRIDPVTNSFVLSEKRTLKQLTEAGTEVDFKPAETLGNLFTIFHQLKSSNLDQGQYLLEHSEKTGAFVTVFQEFDAKAAEGGPGGQAVAKPPKLMDLHARYNMCRPDEERQVVVPAPWIPIDTNVIVDPKRVPCLFTAAWRDPKLWNDPKKTKDKNQKKK